MSHYDEQRESWNEEMRKVPESAKYTVYGMTTGCNPCIEAKKLLEEYKIPYEFRCISNDFNRDYVIGTLKTRSVPAIVAPNGDFIGDLTALRKHLG